MRTAARELGLGAEREERTGPGSAAIGRAEESSGSIWATGELIRCGGGRG
jgi:hypothetical protein